mmetsp:Transcript_13434/g.29449  ORF Transcript_13434/g.29449 Transcript_13434/m.29449 type:complete len:507 (-) Transcript_13434:21-1541(-)
MPRDGGRDKKSKKVKDKKKKAKKSKRRDREDSEPRDMGQMNMMMMGMPPGVSPQMAMMMRMRSMAMAAHGPGGYAGGHLMRPPSMMAPPMLMMGQGSGFPGGAPYAPMGRGARRSKPMRGGSAGRPNRSDQDAGHQSDGSSSSSSSSSSSPAKAGAPPVAAALPAAGATSPLPPSMASAPGPAPAATTAPQKLPSCASATAEDSSVSVIPRTPPLEPEDLCRRRHSQSNGVPPGEVQPKVAPARVESPAVAEASVAAATAPAALTTSAGAGAVPRAAATAAAPATQESDDDDGLLVRPKPRPPPKPGKISFSMKGAKEAFSAARAQVQVEEAVAAARARRLNAVDASTQTVRDPLSQDGDIVTIWRLRPRGMESFPHFPKQAKKKARDVPVICVAAGDEEDPLILVGRGKRVALGGRREEVTRKRSRDNVQDPEAGSGPEASTVPEAEAAPLPAQEVGSGIDGALTSVTATDVDGATPDAELFQPSSLPDPEVVSAVPHNSDAASG